MHRQVFVNNAKNTIRVELKAGESAIGRFIVYDNYGDVSSSGSAIERLLKGTQVYIRVTTESSGFKLKDDTYGMNTFSGHLISK